MEVGTGAGEGYTVNVPLSGGQDDRAYGAILREIVVPVIREYNPDFIIVSAGFDTYFGDPLGTMAVTEQGFACMAMTLIRPPVRLKAGLSGPSRRCAARVANAKAAFRVRTGF